MRNLPFNSHWEHSRMGYMSLRIVRKIKRCRRIVLENPSPFVHPTINNLVEPLVEIIGSNGRERSYNQARVLVSGPPRDLLTFCRLATTVSTKTSERRRITAHNTRPFWGSQRVKGE